MEGAVADLPAQVQATHAQTVAHLAKGFAQTGSVPSIKWFLKYMMFLDEDTLDSLELTDVVLTTGGPLDAPAGSGPAKGEAIDMATAALSNPDIVAQVNKTRFLLTERAIGLKKPEIMGLSWPQVENPFGCHFEDVVRSLGIKELKVLD